MEVIKIRKAKKQDFEDYYKMKKQEAEFYSFMLKEKVKVPLKKQLEKDFFKEIKSNKSNILIAEENEILGYIQFDIFTRLEVKAVFVGDLFVRTNFRGNGVATRLVENCFKIAKEKKASRILLGVLVDNNKALNLYKKFGFKLRRYEMEKKLK